MQPNSIPKVSISMINLLMKSNSTTAAGRLSFFLLSSSNNFTFSTHFCTAIEEAHSELSKWGISHCD